MTAFPFVFSNPLQGDAASLWLSDQGLIRASGPEARSFLQSQLSNDAKLLTPAQAQLSGYCSPKGRLLAVFTVLQLGEDDFVLALPLALVAPTLKRLKMFVLRSKLMLTDASTELPALGVMGDHAADVLDAQGFTVPSSDYGVAQHDGIWLLRRPGPLPRFELRAAPERLAALQQTLGLPSASADDWALAEVLAGIPQVAAETTDHFVPQTINLDSAGGVSFTKGCYPGQEIVARVHYLGRVKQRLRLAQGSTLLAPGTALLNAEGHSVGEVMAAAAHPQLGAVLALSLNLSHAGETPLQAQDSTEQIHPQAAD
ncbi:MAG: hypothetical protein Q7J29_02070 [Stagnimonas sp.]|nr:hypothetical protein [Stagnimonas sp.]